MTQHLLALPLRTSPMDHIRISFAGVLETTDVLDVFQ
jgi:hypothetical protein